LFFKNRLAQAVPPQKHIQPWIQPQGRSEITEILPHSYPKRRIVLKSACHSVPKVTLERLLKLEHKIAIEVAELERLLEG
jgi:hypothetical protein